MIYLGIDTSNYKTSIAAVDDNGRILCNISEYLDVPQGDRGLRQSEAFFRHSNKLPELFNSLAESIDISAIAAIGVSDRPRRVEDSYMPCFLSGVNMARVLSQALNVPLHYFSHQEGHAAAIIESVGSNVISADSTASSAFVKSVDSTASSAFVKSVDSTASAVYAESGDPTASADSAESGGDSATTSRDYNIPTDSVLMHLSGGTTEILKCSMDEQGYSMNILGGTLDISIGQLLDRFGVALGFPFPAGMYIDELASKYNGYKLPSILPGIRVMDGYFNLSGPETVLMKYAEKYLETHITFESSTDDILNSSIDAASYNSKDDQTYNSNVNLLDDTDQFSIILEDELFAVSYELMDRISDVLLKSADIITSVYDIDTVYMAGGVASSETLRKIIRDKHNINIKLTAKEQVAKNSKDYIIIFGEPSLSGDNAVGTALLARRIQTDSRTFEKFGK